MRPGRNTIVWMCRSRGHTDSSTTAEKLAISLQWLRSRVDHLGLFLLLVGLVLGLQGCYVLPGQCVTFPTNYEGDFHGQIISAETGEPIERVVIVGTWDKLVGVGPGGSLTEFYDARETLTDAQGEFTIRGRRFTLFNPIEGMRLLVFKAGYEHFNYPWITYKIDPSPENPARFEGEKLILPLNKWTLEERNRNRSISTSSIPDELIPNMMREISKDRVERGYGPLKDLENRLKKK